ncbi:3-dehydroquinate synthase [Chryseolinea sp. T2]|uniref:3-dehydroquinate synthase n=1 Tax=Chryseolinea sp. T2 TaxID=3129255 RepID=UPI0030784773
MTIPDNVQFTADPAESLRAFFLSKNYSQIVVLTDENTRRHCYPLISAATPVSLIIEVKSGEAQKTLETCIHIWQQLTDSLVDRHGCLVVLGGGVLGDMGGFCAATYKRGIDFVLVPTTLLSQCDASIGGKLGVDFNHFKNHIGVFCFPTLTLLYSGFLKTLPQHELRSGFAEIIKHTLISDRSMWNQLSSKTMESQPWDILVRHSVEFKAKVTAEDPKEKGLRKILNAGHTIGHALETHLLNRGEQVTHGEAVAAGLIAEGYIANIRGLLSKEQLDEISRYIRSVYPRIEIDRRAEEEVCQLILQDKKNRGNKILCVLLNGIGHALWDYEINVDEVKNALTFYQTL